MIFVTIEHMATHVTAHFIGEENPCFYEKIEPGDQAFIQLFPGDEPTKRNTLVVFDQEEADRSSVHLVTEQKSLEKLAADEQAKLAKRCGEKTLIAVLDANNNIHRDKHEFSCGSMLSILVERE